ncbi:helix-turn-helix domain-containing protein [Neorhizobium sp. NPDC001467]|uniref:helix-turn-helix domain-containing protein n=1 Tax=Neorhizobium sp. NPDC001467 TaxID=3390595 RepID=UPI003D01D121
MPAIIPTYDLYGESGGNAPDLRVHCETIAARSSIHRWEIGLHRHERFEQFLYIGSGSGDVLFDDRSVALVPPCVILVPSGQVHGFRFSRDIAGLVITAATDRPAPACDGTAIRVVDFDPASPDAIYVHQTFGRIAEEYNAARPDRARLINAYLAVIAGLVQRQCPDAEKNIGASEALRHVEALRDMIGRHFREQLSASDYAARLGLSPTHLNRVVRKVTGMTAHDLIRARAMDEAKRALALTDASIGHIAEGLGFCDAAYFSRSFRLRTGLSPRDYRRRQRISVEDSAQPRTSR